VQRVRVDGTGRCARRAARHATETRKSLTQCGGAAEPLRGCRAINTGVGPALSWATARRPSRWPGRGVGAGPSHCTPAGPHDERVTLFVIAVPPAAHGLGAGRESPPGRGGEAAPAAGPAAAHARGVEVVAPAAPAAPPLESDSYPSSEQPVHPTSLNRTQPPLADGWTGA